MNVRRVRRWTLLGALALGAGALTPTAAAGPLVDAAPPCGDQVLEQPFTPWLDPFSYTLVPDGGVEAGAAGWTLTGSAGVVEGNEPFQVGSAGDHRSLSIPNGSSATTPAVCVGVEHPTLRFFARNSGSFLSSLQVSVVFEDVAGIQTSLPIGVVAGGSWSPTLPMPVVANVLSLLSGGETAVAFRFTPVGFGGSWRIDDVYVDPYNSR